MNNDVNVDKTKRGLTLRQYAILGFLVDYVDERGYPPSVREIGDGVGLTSTSSVHYQLQVLHDLGWLRVDPGSSRAIDVRPARALPRDRRRAAA